MLLCLLGRIHVLSRHAVVLTRAFGGLANVPVVGKAGSFALKDLLSDRLCGLLVV